MSEVLSRSTTRLNWYNVNSATYNGTRRRLTQTAAAGDVAPMMRREARRCYEWPQSSLFLVGRGAWRRLIGWKEGPSELRLAVLPRPPVSDAATLGRKPADRRAQPVDRSAGQHRQFSVLISPSRCPTPPARALPVPLWATPLGQNQEICPVGRPSHPRWCC